eukprot:6912491-Alexandrium_andersonii.AAC.1
MRRIEGLEAQLAQLTQTGLAIDAELHSATALVRKGRELRLKLEVKEGELPSALAQTTAECDAVSKLKGKGIQELNA